MNISPDTPCTHCPFPRLRAALKAIGRKVQLGRTRPIKVSFINYAYGQIRSVLRNIPTREFVIYQTPLCHGNDFAFTSTSDLSCTCPLPSAELQRHSYVSLNSLCANVPYSLAALEIFNWISTACDILHSSITCDRRKRCITVCLQQMQRLQDTK